MQSVRKAVFPVGGMGTRFLPATKASPKEMMPVVDKPLIQYAVEEAIAAGCDQIIFITGRSKSAITDHFDVSYELERELQERGKKALLEVVRSIMPAHVSAVFVRQPRPRGLGDAIRYARSIVGDEPFAVLVASNLMLSRQPVLAQMMERFERYNTPILGVQEISPAVTTQYGVVEGRLCDENLYQLSGIVEKPTAGAAPSNLAVMGRYILTPEIFKHLEELPRGVEGEIQLTDAIARLLQEQQVLAYRFEGKRFDCDYKLGYLRATVEFAMRHQDMGAGFNAYLRQLCAEGRLPRQMDRVAHFPADEEEGED
ncbi:UTP--glucose-1-phosphate uridylyltransferase GalU [Thermithiobacillus plumbiphilus]|uniref:UTP--glucose-1-phosphate uridylyltransferase n=1 Tax=Thermithiobacillus plumbiphilus TaxID=1729899 RepID=A0ABU9DBA6_9PROT